MSLPPPLPPFRPSPPAPRSAPRLGRSVVVLSVVSVLLAVALVAVSLVLWRERERGDDLADRLAAVEATEPASGRSDSGDEPSAPEPNAGQGDQPSGDQGDRPSGDQGDRPSGDQPRGDQREGDGDDERGDSSGGPEDVLDGLLDGLLGGAGGGLAGLDPACLLGDDGLSGLFGGDRDLPGGTEEQVATIAERVEEQRGLRFSKPVDPVVLPAAEFDARVADMVRDEYPAEVADLDSRVLALLGALAPGTDLLGLQADLLAGQVAGFYDPETGELVVRDDGDGDLDTTEQVTLAHELDHALADQALGLPDIGRDGDSDGNLARVALVEGDATLLMQRYALAHLGLMDQLGQALDPQAAQAQAELEDVAPYLRNELMFPYLSGLAYACRLHAEGGWERVDAAYDDPPTTTAEVVYGDGTSPEDATDPAAPSGSWDEARRDTLGAAQLLWLFGAPGGDERRALDNADDAVRQWAGGELTLFVDGDRSALALGLVDRDEGGALCDAVDRWYGASFDDDQRARDGDAVVFDGGDQTAVLRCEGRQVRLGIGPDLATAKALLS